MEHQAVTIDGFSNGNGTSIELSKIEDGENEMVGALRTDEMMEQETEVDIATVGAIRAEESQSVQGISETVNEQDQVAEIEEEDCAEERDEVAAGEEASEAMEQSSRREFPTCRHMEAAMYNAAMKGNAVVIQSILQQGRPTSALRAQTPAGNSILHIHVAAPADKRAAKVQFIERVLVADPTLVDLANDRGETPLHVAAKFGQLEATKSFVDGNSDLLMRTTIDGDTALHMAVRNNHVNVVDYLLHRSGSVMMDYTVNTAGKTPIYLALKTGSTELITKLLATFMLQDATNLTGSILHAAVLLGDSVNVSKIMEMDHYRNLLDSTDEGGLTPVHYAAGSNNEILEVLLRNESSRTAVYMRDKQGRTAAHIAAQCNDVVGLKALVRYFPDCFEIVDDNKRNVVHYAAMLGCAEALDYFLKESHFSDIVTMEDFMGDTPLHLLASSIPDFPDACLTRVKLLIPKLKSWKLKKMYNNNNHTPGDVARLRNISDMEPACQDVMRDFRKEFPQDGYIKHCLQQPVKEYNKLVTEALRKEAALSMLKTAKYHLLVATLIATLAFAAGLNVPGGFNQNSNDTVKGGTAILARKPAFQVFLIADTISLTSSVIAILIYFYINLGKGRGSAKILFFWAFGATSISMFALMVAFMAGTYSSVQPSRMFATLIVLIPTVFIFCYTIFLCMFVSFLKAVRSLGRMDPRKFKSAV